ncbi:MAG: imidazole glycerol phosphate synthase subunit HisF [Desulfobacteraceae bacterium]|nr:MAG: imidazole glycerol phosphate synthase subunit HisF [Desulfobacteraceae bacterium]
MITLLDYGAGNVRSVTNALEKLGQKVTPVTCAEDILNAEKLLFPGVGNYETMIQILNTKGYIEPLRQYLAQDRPFLGICLGLHALFEGSEEDDSDHESLGVFKGRVKRFVTDLSVPHIGWSGVNIHQDSPMFNGIESGNKFYFVHSYHVVPEDASIILTTTSYGNDFVSAVQKGNIIGTQFHPEKSGPSGIRLLENFVSASPLTSRPRNISRGSGLAKRIIACLDVRANDQGDLVVTKGDQYDVREKGDVRNLGKPVALAKRYYEDGADEITFLNITGFRDFPLEDLPMIQVLKETSKQVFVPLTIGGGIRDYTDSSGKYYSALDVAAQYFRSGADKVSIGSDAVYIAMDYLKTGKKTGTSAIETISRVYGNQAVVISIDPKRVYVNHPDDAPDHRVIETRLPGPGGETYCWYQCTVKGGRETRDIDAATLALACQELGAGEILLNCIDRDGTNSGFDTELINLVRGTVSIPVIASSGAGCAQHFDQVFKETDAEAALAAGIFHRKEVPIQAVKAFLSGQAVEIRS